MEGRLKTNEFRIAKLDRKLEDSERRMVARIDDALGGEAISQRVDHALKSRLTDYEGRVKQLETAQPRPA